jgi:polyisoprenoid-binding protein YceI
MNPPVGRPTRRVLLWVLVGVVGLVMLGFGAILIYANFINDPADELTVVDLAERLQEPTTGPTDTGPTDTGPTDTGPTDTGPTDTGPTDTGVDGTWVITPASELGYRVKEILFGVSTEGVGRTNEITGELVIEDTQVVAASFEVDVASITSDDGRRDGQFRGRIMSTAEFPTATFVLSEPIELGVIPADSQQIVAPATGELTLRGVTNTVTFDVTAQRQDDRIGVLGNIPVVFADYQIANPSISGITTEDNGLLEFVLVFER